MKKRLFILCLCLCLLLTALPGSAYADNKLAFVSINDTLPPELINCFTYYGGTIYVPAWLFAVHGFGIFFSYAPDTSIASLYGGNSILNFDLSSGSTYDESGNQYTLSGIMWGGSVYVPLSYVSSYFGTFSYSTINTQYGTVLRLKDSRVVLSDSEFIKPAMNLLKQYYNAYNKDSDKGDQEKTPTPDSGNDREGVELILSFAGLPGHAELELIESYGLKSCFFLTADQLLQDPDRVRRLAVSGHRIGIMWQGDAQLYAETAELLFEISRVTTVMISSAEADGEACAEFAQELSLAYFRPDVEALYGPEEDISPYTITSVIELDDGIGGIRVLLNCCEGMEETLQIVLNYLTANKFDISSPSEILM